MAFHGMKVLKGVSVARHNQNTLPLISTRTSSKCHLRPGVVLRRRISLAKVWRSLATPVPHGFVTNEDTSIQHHLLDVSVTQGKRIVQSDAVADDFWWKAVAVVQVRFCGHQRKSSYQLPSLSSLPLI